MKSAVETVNPTRVRLTVEVPFAELKPDVDSAYRRIAQQVTIPGFRKGRVPPRLIDQRFGRGLVLEEAVNEALPRLYGQAVEANEVQALGSPEVDLTEVPDPSTGGDLRFTAEVDVRPTFELPAYDELPVTVDPAEVADDDVVQELRQLQERFATLRNVERPAQAGDFVTLDVSGAVDGEAVDDLSAKGLSYEIGSGSLLEGLDDALVGAGVDEARNFATTLAAGEYAGREAQVTATITAVRERDLPELDDEFAMTASEFDTLAELRDDVRGRLERDRRMQQGLQARDRALEALLARVEVPLPESVVRSEIEGRRENLNAQLEAASMTKADYLRVEQRGEEEFDAEVEERAREAIKAQFVLDAVAEQSQIGVEQDELTSHLIRRAYSAGIQPDEFAQRVVQAGQVPLLMSEVIRAKALAQVLESATVTDTAGRPVDLGALSADMGLADDEDDQDVDDAADDLEVSADDHVTDARIAAVADDQDDLLDDAPAAADDLVAVDAAAPAAAGQGEPSAAGDDAEPPAAAAEALQVSPVEPAADTPAEAPATGS